LSAARPAAEEVAASSRGRRVAEGHAPLPRVRVTGARPWKALPCAGRSLGAGRPMPAFENLESVPVGATRGNGPGRWSKQPVGRRSMQVRTRGRGPTGLRDRDALWPAAFRGPGHHVLERDATVLPSAAD